MEIAGVIIAHSVLQGGPGFPCLSPVVYCYILTGSSDLSDQEIPFLSDIPMSAATHDTITLIQEVGEIIVDYVHVTVALLFAPQ